ncbi:Probable lysine-specific demethylase 4B, partial [Gryllus bimaculatus]
MVFRPSYAELRNFSEYVKYMESCGAHHGGIAKIIPPREWKPRKKGYGISNMHLKLQNPIQQYVTGRAGVYKLFHVSQKPVSVTDYSEMAKSAKYKPPKRDLTQAFWKNI